MKSIAREATRGRSTVRIIVDGNFLLLISLIGLYGFVGDQISRPLRAAHLIGGVALAIQLWVILSTLVATTLFVRDLVRRRAAVAKQPWKTVLLDGALLGAWWLALLVICIYAFALGHAG